MSNCNRIDDFLSKLEGVKSTKDGHSARCPGHEDRTASLSINVGNDGRLLVKCHAGCKTPDVMSAVGMNLADLAAPDHRTAPGKPSRKPAARPEGNPYPTWEVAAEAVAKYSGGTVATTWPYHDAAGKEVARIVRVALPDGGKDYRPIRRDADGWRIGGIVESRPLYCLSELPGATRVYVTEGEKAADAAHGIGLTATTSMHGAQSPRKTDWTPLAGKEVVILPDNDKAGSEYAATVARILLALTPPARVRIIELPGLPDKGDIFDWMETRQAAEPEALAAQVETLAAAAPLYSPEGLSTRVTVDADDVSESTKSDPWPADIDDAAFHGLAGDIVRAIEPHSEADPVAILIQLIVAFGNMIGRNTYFRAEADRHFGNLFACLVGSTSKGRKGSSWGHVARISSEIDPEWAASRTASGLSSGEGLIWAVRDPIYKQEPIREGSKGKNGMITGYQELLVDEGVTDKRLLVLESEFASVLKNVARERNTLSAILRQAWETGSLRTLTKNSPAKATGAHISIIAHVTRNELRKLITETDMANGLANRFVWHCVRRSKCLPEGGSLDPLALDPLAERMRAAVTFGNVEREIRRDAAAAEIWAGVYPRLSAGKAGLLGAATSRAESQVMRLAMLYALLDKSDLIRAEHLTAALAVWQHAEASARYIFGSALGDAMADDILLVLRKAGDSGMSRSDIREHFQRHKSSDQIGHALAVLVECSLARSEPRTDTGGRPAEFWFAAA